MRDVSLSRDDQDEDSENQKKWSIFARVLEETLKQHGYTLWSLVSLIGAHPQKVRRLQKSLEIPCAFPTLTGLEMGALRDALCLTADEQRRLAAATMATGMELRMIQVMKPGKEEFALRATEQIYPLLVESIYDVSEELSYLFEGGVIPLDESMLDRQLSGALEAIDRGALALHTIQAVTSFQLQVNFALQSCRDFEQAISELDQLPPTIQAEADYTYWRGEAEAGHAEGLKFLRDHHIEFKV